MHRKAFFILVAFIMIVSRMSAQTDESHVCTPLLTDKTVTQIEVDIHGNIYALVQNQNLYKLDSQGEIIAQFSYPAYGKLSSFSVSNTEKIFLFYKDAGVMLLLTDQMVPLSQPISLFDFDFFNISLATYVNNSFYLLDQQEEKLFVMDHFLKIKQQIQLPHEVQNCKKIVANLDNSVTLYDEREGFFFYDSFGNFEKKIGLKIPHDFQFLGERVIFPDQSSLKEYYFDRLEFKETELNHILNPELQIISLRIHTQFFVVVDVQGKLYLCRLNR